MLCNKAPSVLLTLALASAAADDCISFDFEANAAGFCPAGWTCSGAAKARGLDSLVWSCASAPCGDNAEDPDGNCIVPTGAQGDKVLQVGCDLDTGLAVSDAFLLPVGAVRMTFLRSGGAGAPSGLELRSASTDETLAQDQYSVHTNTMTVRALDVSAWAGQAVFLHVADSTSGNWGKVAVDEIRFLDVSARTSRSTAGRWTPRRPHRRRRLPRRRRR